MNAACFSAWAQKPNRDSGGTKDDDSAREEHGTNSCNASDEAKRRTGEAEREIQKGRVCAHRETSALRRRAAYCLDAEPRIDERVSEAGECGADQRNARPGRHPKQPQANGLD